MDSRRAYQGKRRMPSSYQPVVSEELTNEEEDEDVWSVRSPSSARRYQRPADVRTESGHSADVQEQPGQRGLARSASERHTIPPRRTATQGRMPALPATPPPRIYLDEHEQTERTTDASPGQRASRVRPAPRRRPHWLFFVGLAMLAMILGWVALSAFGSWWQTTLDDWRYGRPRTYQTDAVVGHHDSAQNPSHFMAINLDRRIIVIEIPGGDVSKSVVYTGPTLLGPGQDLTPVTLTFQDINRDGKPDMIVNVQGSQFVFLNQNGAFVPATQNVNSSS